MSTSQRRMSHVEWVQQKQDTKLEKQLIEQQKLEDILKKKETSQKVSPDSGGFKRRESHADWNDRKTQETQLNKMKGTGGDETSPEQRMFQQQLKDLRIRHAIKEFNEKKNENDESLEEVKLREARVSQEARRASLSEKKNRVMMKLMAQRSFKVVKMTELKEDQDVEN